ncbi:Hypothetical predicted protein [Paramuricea clavata]|uniref:3-keto-alpha-glucoside-1,2-lyase/3-keto-2-hydroxy-glucal hydratase domain-containing protein n=1 Tax=Paramuricea clavata TaxID=317549 RepID=A0A6S7GIY6_PARCT|nr:Hypothetical predicted protein [Paramuricea clavata]
MLTVFVVLFQLFSCYALGRSGADLPGKRLQNHGEIHKAKNLIDALSFKLHTKSEKLTLQSNENLVPSASIRDELKMLNKFKELLNDLLNKSSVCEKFYANFDFTAAREILIDSSVSLQNDYTVALQGNKDAGKARQNPENVYLFYDDFSDSNLEKKWQKNWGAIRVENGVLKVKTGRTPTSDKGEISVFVKHGHEWEDIEVELDLNERNNVRAPGPFLRVQDARIQSTTAWWFEYVTGSKLCTMRPFKNNKDGSWLYRGTLPKALSAGLWYHAKFRVVGDRFSHWINNVLIQNNVKVSSQWMINKGTFGLGCHTYDIGCDTSYDNIKITKYIPVLPTVSLGTECKVDLKKFHGLGTSEKNPATSCKQVHDISLKDGKLDNGLYWIKTSADRSVQTYCDLTNGGWTLVGKVSGFVNKLYKFWLIKNYNVVVLNSPALPSKVGCIDARYLATYHASTVMFSSGDNKNGIGSKWVQWSLPYGRESDSLWTHSVGRTTASKARMHPVTVKAWNGKEQVCYQNKYGIMPLPQHGGSYPSATYNTAGNTRTKDYCMAVGVQKRGTTADGWTQNGNGYDSARSDSDWPNSQYNYVSPYITVWLK